VWADSANSKERICEEKSVNEVHLRGKGIQGKVVPVYAMKAYKGSRGLTPLILDVTTRFRRVTFHFL
jgi:hypothetical protein